MEGPIFGGAYIRREVCVSKSANLILGGKFASLKIDWASLFLGRRFTVFLCFTLYSRRISKYKLEFGGLIFEGLIFGILRYMTYRLIKFRNV